MTIQRTLRLTAVAVALLAMTACGKKKASEDIITIPLEQAKPQGPISMSDYNDSRDVEWIGKNYHVNINRQPADSLPMVKDETGQQFVDNVFMLSVSRADGSVFFSRRFTKSFFAQYVPEEYRRGGILEGIVFDKADGDWLQFAASIAIPQTDEYVPLSLRLSRMGELAVQKDMQLDTNGDRPDGL